MKKALLIFLILLILTSASNAFPVKEFTTKIEVYYDGTAKVNNKIVFDSRNTESYIYIPSYKPEDIIVNDKKERLRYAEISNFILIKPATNEEDYEINLQYTTNVLTSKTGEKWKIVYALPSKDVLRYETNRTTVIIQLPSTSTMLDSTEGRITFVEGNKLSLGWNTELKTEENIISATYKTRENTTKLWQYILITITIVLGIILLIIFCLYISNKYFKTISKGKRDLINTLSRREQEIVNLLLKSKDALNQAIIQKTTGISKATLSRTVKKLEAKKIIEIRSAGNTNIIALTEWFEKL